jgi:hypothetical protein
MAGVSRAVVCWLLVVGSGWLLCIMFCYFRLFVHVCAWYATDPITASRATTHRYIDDGATMTGPWHLRPWPHATTCPGETSSPTTRTCLCGWCGSRPSSCCGWPILDPWRPTTTAARIHCRNEVNDHNAIHNVVVVVVVVVHFV